MTRVCVVDPVAPASAVLAEAAALLRAGGLVAFPTETVYGLGANAEDGTAVERIFAAKGRPATNPVIVHVASPTEALRVAADWPPTAETLARHFWPGPLTLVLPRRVSVPDVVTAGGPTVAVRCPRHPVALALLRAAGVPVAAPSANRSTELSPTRAEHVWKSLHGRIDLILDGGPCPGGIESTVLDLCGEVPRLLRPGLITVPMLNAVVGPVATDLDEESIARSPGQMRKHYSPRTPLRLASSNEEAQALWQSDPQGTAWLAFGDHSEATFHLPAEPSAYAARLYDTLHQFDTGCWKRILLTMPPDTPDWLALRDRLRRAASQE